MVEIRHLQQEDNAFAISHVYEESWRFAYKHIIPQSYLDSIPVGRWAPHLRKEGMYTLVMLEKDSVIGTSSYCESRFPEFSGMGEIVSIYLLPEYMGKGYGRLLLQAAVEELKKSGYREIFLWVLEENHRARAFYEKNGFVQSDRYLEDTIGGKQLREIQYCYSVKEL